MKANIRKLYVELSIPEYFETYVGQRMRSRIPDEMYHDLTSDPKYIARIDLRTLTSEFGYPDDVWCFE